MTIILLLTVYLSGIALVIIHPNLNKTIKHPNMIKKNTFSLTQGDRINKFSGESSLE